MTCYFANSGIALKVRFFIFNEIAAFSIFTLPMKSTISPKNFIYTALPCEAKPLIEFFHLKKDTAINSFAVYVNNETCLTVTGIGKTAMSAGIAYSLALFSSTPNPVLLNVGIAGHKVHPIGSVFLIDKITDSDSGRRYYPPLIFTPPCPTHNLQTAAKPQLTYHPSYLCDMEASAFYETATRFTSGELIQCLKIVSDNESSPVHNVQANQVSELIRAQLETIAVLLKELTQLADLLAKPESPELNNLLNRYHFTANEQIQLKKLLSRWCLVKEGNRIEIAGDSAKNGREFLDLLNQSLNESEFYL
jgi:adenosylhomocysteine nucleosidase